MPLMPCPACSTEVSDAALACPRCAHPLNPAPATRPVTVEQTSKKYKKAQVLSVAMLVTATLLLVSSGGVGTAQVGLGTVMFLAGLVVYLYSRVGAWWNNG
jgi:hypothetical protein